MNILTGLDTASEGKVILDGVDAAQLDEIGRQRFRAEKNWSSLPAIPFNSLFDRT